MEASALKIPGLVGREKELAKLQEAFDYTLKAKGSTLLISGEAGIGKTRLVSELGKHAEEKGASLIKGWCLAESLEPLMPMKEMLRSADLHHLLSAAPPPEIISIYLLNRGGLLISKAEREKSGLDPDIFAGMLTAVENFMKDSLSHLDREGAGLNTIGYGKYNIILQSRVGLSIVAVIQGKANEFLLDDMESILEGLDEGLAYWSGSTSEVDGIDDILEGLISTGKYDGRRLVDDPKLKQENLFDNVLLGIQRLSSTSPLVFFIDDLQWADPTTLNLVHYLARNTRDNRVLMVGTYRPEDIGQGHDGKAHLLSTVMQNMSREGLFQTIELKRLDEEGTRALVSQALGGGGLDVDFYGRIHSETGGTPFFVLEVLLYLRDAGALIKEEDGWTLQKGAGDLDIPSRVFDVIKRRLDRLAKEQIEVLEVASVIGEEFGTELLQKVTGMQKLSLLKSLGDIEMRHKLVRFEDERYRFDHAKIREVLYKGIGEALRREYHRMVGAGIEEIQGDRIDDYLNELAHHYHVSGDEKAFEYLILAANKAKNNYANAEAIGLFESAVELAPEDDKRKLYSELGGLHSLIGEMERCIECFEKALELCGTEHEEASIHANISKAYELSSSYDKSLQHARKGLGLLSDEGDNRVMADLYHSIMWAHLRRGDYDDAGNYAHKQVEVAEALGDERYRGRANHDLGTLLMYTSNFHEAIKAMEKAVEQRKAAGDQYGLGKSINNLGAVYHFMGELEKALEKYHEALETRESIGDNYGIASTTGNLGIIEKMQGKYQDALKSYRKSIEVRQRVGDIHGVAASYESIGLVYLERGKLQPALTHCKKALEFREKIGDLPGIGASCANLGDIYCELDEYEKATEILKRGVETGRKLGDKIMFCHNSLTMADALIGQGELENAEQYGLKLMKTAEEVGVQELVSGGCRILGRIHSARGEWERSAKYFEKSIEAASEIAEKARLGTAHYYFAIMWGSKGDRDKRREHLKKSLEIFEERGAKLWVERARRELDQ